MLTLPRAPPPFIRPQRLPFSPSRWRRLASASAPSRTQKIMEGISTTEEVGGAGGAYSYDALKRLDQILSRIANDSSDGVQKTEVVFKFPGSSTNASFDDDISCTLDIVICGGKLGIFLATALACKGLRVGIVERNILKGRSQEWNISTKELMELVHANALSEDEMELCTVSKINPNRCGFGEKGEIWVEDILDLGVSPVILLEVMKKRFTSLGGIIFEENGLSSVHIYNDAAIVHLADGRVLSSQLVIDAMGNFSPIVRQIRQGKKPDGVCLLVGSCCRGFKDNLTRDVIFSSSSVRKVGSSILQYFWEAFPAGSGSTDRTTYMFTYVKPQPGCPKLEDLLEDYWIVMPEYQDVSLDELEILRVVFGIFPAYCESPLPAAFDRILQVGDASGIQSPYSFRGFGSMTRHIGRLSDGIYEAFTGGFLDSESLSLLNPYMPNLSSAWLFQKAMSASTADTGVSPTFINELVHAHFTSMQRLGKPVLQPFLQDVIQFWPFLKTLGSLALNYPQLLPSIVRQLGVAAILNWLTHFVALGRYTFLSSFVDPLIRPWINKLPKKERYRWRRHLEAWKYGAGLDYTL